MGTDNHDFPAELACLIDALPEPRIVVDMDYRILAANAAYRDTYSTHGEIVGRRCYEASHHYPVPCHEAGESCPRQQALRSGRTEKVLHIHHTPRGEEHVQVELSPILDRRGQMRYFVERMQALPRASFMQSSPHSTTFMASLLSLTMITEPPIR